MRLIEKSNTLKLFESLNSANSATDPKFKETVLRDFKNFIEDKYDIKNFNELNRKLKNLSEKDIDDYFTGMFYEIADTGDTESVGLAREIIIDEFGVLDTYSDDYEYDDGDTNWAAEEEADALERMERRYGSMDESSKFLKEALDSSIDSIVDDVLSGNEVYVRLDEKDYSSEEGSNIYKIEYSYSIERPEDYDNGYNSGWDRGQDEEFDKKQDERFEKATKAYEEGEVFEFNCVKIEDGKIQYTGFCLLKCFGIEELRHNLEYYKAKRIGVKTISSFEDLTEGVKHITESANDRYQVREFDGPGAKFGVYDTKQKKFIQKGSKKIMIAGCDELNKKASNKHKVKESVEEHDLSKDLFGDEAANRMSQKEKKLKRDLQYVRDIMAGKKVIDDKYHEEISLNTAKYWLRDDFIYVNELSSYDSDEVNKRLADAYPDIFGVNESAKLEEAKKPSKEKKEDKRVVMQQGNVTCFKENDNTYLVFENESDNEVEHDSEESAMHDFLERVGIDANAELKEK